MPTSAENLFSGRLRLIQYVSNASVLLSCIAFALLVGREWAWGPFLVCPLISAAGWVATAAVVRAGRAALASTPEQVEAATEDARRRRTVTIPGYATMGLSLGVIAGSTRSYWPDVLLAAGMLLIGVVLPLALLPALKRRSASRRG